MRVLATRPVALLRDAANADGRGPDADGPRAVAAPDVERLNGRRASCSNDAESNGRENERDGTDVGSHRHSLDLTGELGNGDRAVSGVQS